MSAIPVLQSAWYAFLKAIAGAVIGEVVRNGAAPYDEASLAQRRGTMRADAPTARGGQVERFWSAVRRNRLQRGLRAGIGSMD